MSADTNCVEVATIGDAVLVRDSKDPDGPYLRLTANAWRVFLAGIDELDFQIRQQ